MTLDQVPRYEPDPLSSQGDRAVVVGGSMAGLLSARVLADAFDLVTVVERDALPDESVARRSVPQANQPHTLWEAGRASIEDLCPGFSEDLLLAGAQLIDISRDLHAYAEGGFFAVGPRRLPMHSASRPLFEAVLRRHVLERDDVEVRAHCTFLDYLVDDDGTTVRGVSVRDAESGDAPIEADLVVDATGRTSRTPAWLADNGFDAPPTDEVHVDLAYSTAVLERPVDARQAYIVRADPPQTRGAFVFPVEGDRWMVTLHGIHGDHPPTDLADFAAFADTLPVPHVKRLVETHEWMSDDVAHYPFPSSLRRRYEDLDRFPTGLVVVGDAIASFNPLNGQGMSVAALDALQLHHALGEGSRETLASRYFDRVEPVVDTAWRMAVGADHQFAATEGPKPRGTDLFARYLSRLIRKAHTDPKLSEAYGRVVVMERSPTSLLHPTIAWRVLRPGGRLPRRVTPAGQPSTRR
ncbi:FAD-dependent oxidoreductase [Halobacteriales archaeon Cl-PHB]